jgi:hypothetical protein
VPAICGTGAGAVDDRCFGTDDRGQPRATTAAWLTGPPVAVIVPAATAMPGTSAGLVSGRSRMVEASSS